MVLEAMMPYLKAEYGNASSLTHTLGRSANAAVERAREQVAQAIGASSPGEIVFTSGATEAINMALKGVFERYSTKGKHFITCQTEHKAVLDTFAYLEKRGAEVTYLGVDATGRIDPEEVRAAIRRDTVLLCIMSANNETGVCQPVEQLAHLASKHGILYFCDATQSLGKSPIDVRKSPIDLLCFSAHKLYGPKGAGGLYIRKRTRRIQVEPLFHGGKQELGLRAGTLNVPAIVGMGEAITLSMSLLESESARLSKLRRRLEKELTALPQVFVNGEDAERLPHVSNITIRHLPAEILMGQLPMFGMATGSACVSGTRDPSHVLMAMGMDAADARSSIRLSLGRFNTSSDVERVCEKLSAAIARLREKAPAWLLYERGLIK